LLRSAAKRCRLYCESAHWLGGRIVMALHSTRGASMLCRCVPFNHCPSEVFAISLQDLTCRPFADDSDEPPAQTMSGSLNTPIMIIFLYHSPPTVDKRDRILETSSTTAGRQWAGWTKSKSLSFARKGKPGVFVSLHICLEEPWAT